eukprot:337543-Karenia_brevis.AAC.1
MGLLQHLSCPVGSHAIALWELLHRTLGATAITLWELLNLKPTHQGLPPNTHLCPNLDILLVSSSSSFTPDAADDTPSSTPPPATLL